MIPYGRQNISEADVQAVVDVLRSDYLTQGPVLPQFERAIVSKVNASHAVAVNSGTSALHIACLALGLGKGDWLWTSSNTFVSSANCGLYCGAKVDFVDIDSQTYNMSILALEKKLQEAEKKGVLPKIIIPVHFAGQSCDMRAIAGLAKRYGFFIIEDACHAIGGLYLKQPIGCCKYSDIAVFSFHPVKIITTAEGGMAVTNQPILAEKMKELRQHGITRKTSKMTHEAEGDWYYQQIELGFNYRMTELQAALGISQIQSLDKFVAIRHKLQQRYDKILKELPLILPYQDPENYSALHLYPIQVNGTKSRKRIFDELRHNGIGVNVHYIPVHTQPYYQNRGFKQGDYPVAEAYYSKAISLPLFYDLTLELQDQVVETLTKVLP